MKNDKRKGTDLVPNTKATTAISEPIARLAGKRWNHPLCQRHYQVSAEKVVTEGVGNATGEVERTYRVQETDGMFRGLRKSAIFRVMSDRLLRISEVVELHIDDLESNTLWIRSSNGADREGVRTLPADWNDRLSGKIGSVPGGYSGGWKVEIPSNASTLCQNGVSRTRSNSEVQGRKAMNSQLYSRLQIFYL